MQISSTVTGALTTATSGGQANGRLQAADLAAQLLPSVPITAVVKSVQSGQALLDLGTTTLLLRTTDNSLTPGSTVTVRFQENGKGIVDLGDGKTTTVTLETGDATAPANAKSAPAPTRLFTNPAVYTPALLARNIPTFSQPIIRVEVLPAPDATPKAPVKTVVPTEAATPAEVAVPVPEGETPTTNQPAAQQAATVVPQPVGKQVTGPTVQQSQLYPALQAGEVLVSSDGREFAARFADEVPDTSNGPVFVKVTTTPRGLVLTPLADTPQLPVQLATALIRSSPNRPEIGTVVQNLFQPATKAEPASAVDAQTTKTGAAESLKNLTDFLTALLPQKGQPPDAGQIAQFVKHGGLMYESKLAEAVANKVTPKEAEQIPVGDVKGQVMQALKEAGPVERATPLHDALNSIESQQALNVLASQSGEGIRLQLPVWDQNQWRTMDLTITPEMADNTPDGRSSQGYDIFMHTEMTEFGDTYIDVQVHSGSFRSILYIEQDNARNAAKAALGDLNQEVRSIGFQQVFVDVRSTSELPAKTRQQANAFKAGVPVGVSMLDVRV
ncbi:hypothetical protein [Zavarzinella formosa]|uniref:hypothetical protein n=1 Tax=Zavarzinella formosa TaxID=360055 RepID=UPI00030F1B2B|nr:hypothetical protein [Zavarzinella formosa]